MPDLPVRGVYLYFKALERVKTGDGNNALESFLTECDQKQLTVGVSKVLYAIGDNHFKELVRINVAGPDCPACPSP